MIKSEARSRAMRAQSTERRANINDAYTQQRLETFYRAMKRRDPAEVDRLAEQLRERYERHP